MNLPKFLASTSWANPADPAHTNWHHLHGESLWSYLAKHDQEREDSANVMRMFSSSQPSWTTVYPTQTLVDQIRPERAVFVDIGGGLGVDVQAMQKKHPDLPEGFLVLQDTPQVVAQSPLPECAKQGYDFFTPNPIKGARAYHLRRVLHDWADDKAVEILKNQTVAMEKGYSRLFIREQVVTTDGRSQFGGMADMVMMMIASAKERTEEMWQELLMKAGLRIVKIWWSVEAAESVIEAELI